MSDSAGPERLLGVRTPPVEHHITAEAIRRFAAAVDARQPLHHDAEAARRLGYADVVAPPTAAAMLLMEPIRTLATDPELQLDYAHLVHGDQRFDYGRPIVAGDHLTVAGEVSEAYQRAGHLFVVVTTEARDPAGATVVRGRSTLVIRGGGAPT